MPDIATIVGAAALNRGCAQNLAGAVDRDLGDWFAIVALIGLILQLGGGALSTSVNRIFNTASSAALPNLVDDPSAPRFLSRVVSVP